MASSQAYEEPNPPSPLPFPISHLLKLRIVFDKSINLNFGHLILKYIELILSIDFWLCVLKFKNIY